MDAQKNIVDVLLYFIPALLVLGALFLLVKKFLDRDYRLKLIDAKQIHAKRYASLAPAIVRTAGSFS